MEVKINREIRSYTESIFFGLSLRQFIFSVLACLVAILMFFLFRNKVNMEILSWICIMSAIPFAGLGFITYNGMTAEKFFVAWLKSEILTPRCIKYESSNFYYDVMKPVIMNKVREEFENVKNN